MIKSEHGFSHILGLAAVVGVLAIGGVGYGVMNHSNKIASESTVAKPNLRANSSTSTVQPLSTVGTAQNIDSLTAQDASSESSIDSSHSSSDQTSSRDAESAALNVGGAYDESAL